MEIKDIKNGYNIQVKQIKSIKLDSLHFDGDLDEIIE
jgi:hypothetical protein